MARANARCNYFLYIESLTLKKVRFWASANSWPLSTQISKSWNGQTEILISNFITLKTVSDLKYTVLRKWFYQNGRSFWIKSDDQVGLQNRVSSSVKVDGHFELVVHFVRCNFELSSNTKTVLLARQGRSNFTAYFPTVQFESTGPCCFNLDRSFCQLKPNYDVIKLNLDHFR